MLCLTGFNARFAVFDFESLSATNLTIYVKLYSSELGLLIFKGDTSTIKID